MIEPIAVKAEPVREPAANPIDSAVAAIPAIAASSGNVAATAVASAPTRTKFVVKLIASPRVVITVLDLIAPSCASLYSSLMSRYTAVPDVPRFAIPEYLDNAWNAGLAEASVPTSFMTSETFCASVRAADTAVKYALSPLSYFSTPMSAPNVRVLAFNVVRSAIRSPPLISDILSKFIYIYTPYTYK